MSWLRAEAAELGPVLDCLLYTFWQAWAAQASASTQLFIRAIQLSVQPVQTLCQAAQRNADQVNTLLDWNKSRTHTIGRTHRKKGHSTAYTHTHTEICFPVDFRFSQLLAKLLSGRRVSGGVSSWDEDSEVNEWEKTAVSLPMGEMKVISGHCGWHPESEAKWKCSYLYKIKGPTKGSGLFKKTQFTPNKS